MQNIIAVLENNFVAPQKNIYRPNLTHNSASRYTPKRNENTCPERTCTQMFIAVRS